MTEMTAGRGSEEVNRYIRAAPRRTRAQLTAIRTALRSALPRAIETISYGMPGYSFPGYPYRGMVAWFGLQKGHIGLYLRPPTIFRHRHELRDYRTTKSAVQLPLDRKLPITLIRTLARASAREVRSRGGRAREGQVKRRSLNRAATSPRAGRGRSS